MLQGRFSLVEKFRRRSLAFGAYCAACRKTGEQQRLLRCVPTRILRVSRLRGNRVSNAGNRETHVNPLFAQSGDKSRCNARSLEYFRTSRYHATTFSQHSTEFSNAIARFFLLTNHTFPTMQGRRWIQGTWNVATSKKFVAFRSKTLHFRRHLSNVLRNAAKADIGQETRLVSAEHDVQA